MLQQTVGEAPGGASCIQHHFALYIYMPMLQSFLKFKTSTGDILFIGQDYLYIRAEKLLGVLYNPSIHYHFAAQNMGIEFIV